MRHPLVRALIEDLHLEAGRNDNAWTQERKGFQQGEVRHNGRQVQGWRRSCIIEAWGELMLSAVRSGQTSAISSQADPEAPLPPTWKRCNYRTQGVVKRIKWDVAPRRLGRAKCWFPSHGCFLHRHIRECYLWCVSEKPVSMDLERQLHLTKSHLNGKSVFLNPLRWFENQQCVYQCFPVRFEA